MPFERVRRFLPARTVPVTPWRAATLWRARPLTFVVLVAGLWLFGSGEACLVAANVGVSPWTVLAQGVARHSGIDIGLATFLVSAVVLLVWVPLRERPGLGTLANAVVIAVSLGVMVGLLPELHHRAASLVVVLAGIALIGLGSGLYLTAAMGPGPRDGLMTGLHRRTGLPVTPVRLALEVVVLVTGWLLGGQVGLGTVLFALLIGPAVGYGLALTTPRPPRL